jgi:hypothetical protein
MHYAPGLNRRLGTTGKMHFIFEVRRWLKIGLNPEPHLKGICEIIESDDYLTFQDLFLGETKCLKLDNIFAGKL